MKSNKPSPQREGLDLMEWKNVERNSVEGMRQADVQYQINAILYEHAIIAIKNLNGMTMIEEDELANKKREEAERQAHEITGTKPKSR